MDKQKFGEAVDGIKNGALNFGDKVIKVASKAANDLEDAKEKFEIELEKNKYQPFFEEDIEVLPKTFSIFDKDEYRKKSSVCEGAIGHIEKIKKDVNDLYNFYPENISKISDKFGISFCGEVKSSIYIVNPYDQKQYIDADKYFDYLNKEVCDELEEVARCLGAKYFQIKFLEEQRSIINKNKKAKIKVKNGIQNVDGNVSGSVDYNDKKFREFQKSKEVHYEGGNPQEPKLKYLKNDSEIVNLVNQRLQPNGNKASKIVCIIETKKELGINKKGAMDLDAQIEHWQMGGNYSFLSAFEEQSIRKLEYTIEF